MRRGLIASALSLAGLVVGAYVGSRVAPHLLHGGVGLARGRRSRGSPARSPGRCSGRRSPGSSGSFVRGGLRLTPFRFLDSAGGFVLGAVAGLALVWVIGATALLIPGQTRYRQEAQKSQLLKKLNGVVPPRQLLHLLARIDPFPSIAGPAGADVAAERRDRPRPRCRRCDAVGRPGARDVVRRRRRGQRLVRVAASRRHRRARRRRRRRHGRRGSGTRAAGPRAGRRVRRAQRRRGASRRRRTRDAVADRRPASGIARSRSSAIRRTARCG